MTLLDLLFAAGEVSVTAATTATIGRMHVCSGTTADYTVTLPAASGNAGKLIGFRMSPALTKLVTLDGNSSEAIDGATTRVMWAEESALLLCDGRDWFKIAGKTRAMLAAMYASTSVDVPNLTKTQVPLDAITSDPTGAMADTMNKRFNIKRPGIYSPTGYIRFCSATTYTNALTADAPRILTGIRINGTLTTPFGETYGHTNAFPAVGFTLQLTLAVGDYIDFVGVQTSGSTQGMMGFDAFSSVFSSASIIEVPQW